MAIAAASISSTERAARVTSAPACASAAANARPMPLPAPVTSARRPSNRNDGVLGKSLSLGPPSRFNRPVIGVAPLPVSVHLHFCYPALPGQGLYRPKPTEILP